MAYTEFKPFLLLAASGVQAGSGSELGIVDKTIQREKHTGYPKIEAASLKGVVKDHVRTALAARQGTTADDILEILLGPEKGDKHGSAAGLMDARLLFFPVATVKGVFAWVTCPLVLRRFAQDMTDIDFSIEDNKGAIPITSIPMNRLASNGDALTVPNGNTHAVVFEKSVVPQACHDKDMERFVNWLCTTFMSGPAFSAASCLLPEHALTVSDQMFLHFVLHDTEIIARNKIDDNTGTVASSGPWYEEYLPQESILYSQIMARKPFGDGIPVNLTLDGKSLDSAQNILSCVRGLFPAVIQLGANATVGKGFLKIGFPT